MWFACLSLASYTWLCVITGSELIVSVLNIVAHVAKISRFLSPFRSENKLSSLPAE